jgi:hypothetical protein
MVPYRTLTSYTRNLGNSGRRAVANDKLVTPNPD